MGRHVYAFVGVIECCTGQLTDQWVRQIHTEPPAYAVSSVCTLTNNESGLHCLFAGKCEPLAYIGSDTFIHESNKVNWDR